jgi:hypothetical protein
MCDGCCVSSHLTSPFHRIQKFNGDFFENADLEQLGLVIDLRQHHHDCIPTSQHLDDLAGSDADLSDDENDNDNDNDADPAQYQPSGQNRSYLPRSNLIIVSSTGIFKRSMKWCRCANAPEPYVQLLRAKLFPASFMQPSTAFTFEVLDHFHLDALECKTAAMNFMSKIVRISNEAFPGKVPVCILNSIAVHPSSGYDIGPVSRTPEGVPRVERSS